MTKFNVIFKEVHDRTVQVEAETKEEALEKATNIIENGEDEIVLEFSHKLDCTTIYELNEWRLITKDSKK